MKGISCLFWGFHALRGDSSGISWFVPPPVPETFAVANSVDKYVSGFAARTRQSAILGGGCPRRGCGPVLVGIAGSHAELGERLLRHGFVPRRRGLVARLQL